MPINSRAKGQTGEREIATALNKVVIEVEEANGIYRPDDAMPQVQRNQNQSAVGGDDLIGTYNFSIEIKNQKDLSVNTWWKQACASAARQGKQPVLIYKIHRKGWKVVMGGGIGHQDGNNLPKAWTPVARLEVELDDFVNLFREVVRKAL
jgi:hypothetical protein